MAAVVKATISAPFRLPAAPHSEVMLCCELDPASGGFTALSRGGHDERANLHMASSSRQTARERVTARSSSRWRAVEAVALQHTMALADLFNGGLDLAPRTALAEVGQPSTGKADGYRVHPGALDSGLQLGQLCLGPHAGGHGACNAICPCHDGIVYGPLLLRHWLVI